MNQRKFTIAASLLCAVSLLAALPATADEYDAARARGEVTTRADQNLLPNQKKVSAGDIGLAHKGVKALIVGPAGVKGED